MGTRYKLLRVDYQTATDDFIEQVTNFKRQYLARVRNMDFNSVTKRRVQDLRHLHKSNSEELDEFVVKQDRRIYGILIFGTVAMEDNSKAAIVTMVIDPPDQIPNIGTFMLGQILPKIEENGVEEVNFLLFKMREEKYLELIEQCISNEYQITHKNDETVGIRLKLANS